VAKYGCINKNGLAFLLKEYTFWGILSTSRCIKVCEAFHGKVFVMRRLSLAGIFPGI
jgi:hypothetical protein